MKNIKLLHKVSTKLLITPQLKQAIHILQLPYAAFRIYMERKIAENPLLQSLDKEDIQAKIKSLLNSNNNFIPDPVYQKEERGTPLESVEKHTQTASLQEYLLQQLKMTFLNKEELPAAQELISHIDTNGYLRVSLDGFAQEHGIALDKAEKILKVIQELEPSGIGARNLQECLLIQLNDRERTTSLAYKIVAAFFKELSRKKYHLIEKKLNISIDEIKTAVKEILTLNPRPGMVLSPEKDAIIVKPDIFISIHKNKCRITLNNRDIPDLKINQKHRKLLSDPETPEGVKQFIRERLKNALWLIKAVEQRQKNILKTMRVIAEIQKQALSKDLSYLKPLSLKDVALLTGLHLSTIGRIIAHKYIDTPQGIIKAKELFSGRFKSNKDGYLSSKNISQQIKEIIMNEDRTKPFTDKIIADILHKKGIQISRRTIAKYRNFSKIAPSFLR